MSKPINGEILKKLREFRGWTQVELADRARINKDTVSRLERGEQSGAGRAGKAIAKAFDVEVAVLTGEAKIPAPTDDPDSSWLDRFTYPLNVRVDASVRNAFELVAARYKISVEQIVKVAPFLFVLAAERSLVRRRLHLKQLEERLDEAEFAASKFLHLPTTFIPRHGLGEAIGAEEESIDGCDIFAERLENDGIWRFHTRREDYETDEHNPFVESLREEAATTGIASITSYSSYAVNFTVCGKEAMRLTGGDKELAKEILSGAIPLHELPDAYRTIEALEQRLTWMNEKTAERQASMRELFDDFWGPEIATPDADGGATP